MTGVPDKLNMALPDGHLMAHVEPFLKGTGLAFNGYDKDNLTRRPILRVAGEQAKQRIAEPERIALKVIRPQDMPVHVANANFDLAISGTDWLTEHQLCFPKSPVIEILRFGFSKVRIVAAVHENEGGTVRDVVQSFRRKHGDRYIKIASEYVYLADHWAHQNRLYPYRIIKTYGATESLIPEDCDIIIENTETGNTLRKNRLKIIDTLMIAGSDWSEGCMIANRESLEIPWKQTLVEGFRSLFEEALNQARHVSEK